MRGLILSLVTLILMAADASGTEKIDLVYVYDFQRMEEVINSVAGINEIPSFSGVSGAEEVQAPASKPTPELKALFQSIQSGIFGSTDLIDLKLCLKCGFLADYSSKTIFYSESYAKAILSNTKLKNPLNVLRYLFTHELSHFIHEISAHPPFSKIDFRTINGFSSAYISADIRIEDLLPSHTEVDVYAMLILKNSSFDGWSDILKFFDHEIEEQKSSDAYPVVTKLVLIDFTNRKHVINELRQL